MYFTKFRYAVSILVLAMFLSVGATASALQPDLKINPNNSNMLTFSVPGPGGGMVKGDIDKTTNTIRVSAEGFPNQDYASRPNVPKRLLYNQAKIAAQTIAERDMAAIVTGLYIKSKTTVDNGGEFQGDVIEKTVSGFLRNVQAVSEEVIEGNGCKITVEMSYADIPEIRALIQNQVQ